MNIPFAAGLHSVGNQVYAYLQPDGSWGWSNAGLIVDGDQSLLVDTLFDCRLTGRMLDQMRRHTPAAAAIDIVVNTHANGDHCWGNELVAGSRIIASAAAAAEMSELPPAQLAQLMRNAPNMGQAGAYLTAIFGAFDFENIHLTLPTETFDGGQLEVQVGDRKVLLIEVGPAHTRGDVLVYLPDERVLFTGDIVFNGSHPILWAGPAASWIAACDRILGMAVDIVVPGHGPVTDKSGVRQMKGYLEYLTAEARSRYDAGMSFEEAARDIRLDDYATWSDPERVILNLAALYREFGADEHIVPADVMALFTKMIVSMANP